MQDFKNKVVVITGAGSGIGRATAELFAAEGARVVLADIDEAAARSVLETLPRADECLAWGCDIADGAAVERLFAEVERRYGRLDVLVNNAGLGQVPGDGFEHYQQRLAERGAQLAAGQQPEVFTDMIVDLTDAGWHRLRAINLDGAFYCSRAAVRLMIACASRGSIINIASLSALSGEGPLAYCATKAAVISLTQSAGLNLIHDETEPHGFFKFNLLAVFVALFAFALFTAGLGTLLFQVVTGRQVPVFLASSFAFITPIILAKGQFGLAETMGGVMAAGFVYTFMGLMVKINGTGFIDRMLPPVVIGPVIISIGLAMAPIAANMAMGKGGDGTALMPYKTAMLISMPALLTTLIVAVFGKGIFRLVPIISGVLVGFAMAFYFGVVDTAKIAAAPWFAIPHFTAPEFNWQAILFIVPVALAPAIEHIGGVIAVGSVTGRDYLKKPGLHRTLLGDGIATTTAGSSICRRSR